MVTAPYAASRKSLVCPDASRGFWSIGFAPCGPSPLCGRIANNVCIPGMLPSQDYQSCSDPFACKRSKRRRGISYRIATPSRERVSSTSRWITELSSRLFLSFEPAWPNLASPGAGKIGGSCQRFRCKVFRDFRRREAYGLGVIGRLSRASSVVEVQRPDVEGAGRR